VLLTHLLVIKILRIRFTMVSTLHLVVRVITKIHFLSGALVLVQVEHFVLLV